VHTFFQSRGLSASRRVRPGVGHPSVTVRRPEGRGWREVPERQGAQDRRSRRPRGGRRCSDPCGRSAAYGTTSSARASTEGGIVKPSLLAEALVNDVAASRGSAHRAPVGSSPGSDGPHTGTSCHHPRPSGRRTVTLGWSHQLGCASARKGCQPSGVGDHRPDQACCSIA
jgi:hypothetical protein